MVTCFNYFPKFSLDLTLHANGLNMSSAVSDINMFYFYANLRRSLRKIFNMAKNNNNVDGF